jgi:hypothetical protein
MRRAEETQIRAVRFGWSGDRLCLLVIPGSAALLPGLEIEVRVARAEGADDPVLAFTLEEGGSAGVTCTGRSDPSLEFDIAWREVVEISLAVGANQHTASHPSGLVLRIGRSGMTEHMFHTAGLESLGWGEE